MEQTILIEKRFENLFRQCTCKFNSMAIAAVKEPKKLPHHLQIVIESTDDDDKFIEDLFYLGKAYGKIIEYEEF